jgi:hypothetical protein
MAVGRYQALAPLILFPTFADGARHMTQLPARTAGELIIASPASTAFR